MVSLMHTVPWVQSGSEYGPPSAHAKSQDPPEGGPTHDHSAGPLPCGAERWTRTAILPSSRAVARRGVPMPNLASCSTYADPCAKATPPFLRHEESTISSLSTPVTVDFPEAEAGLGLVPLPLLAGDHKASCTLIHSLATAPRGLRALFVVHKASPDRSTRWPVGQCG